MFFGGVVSSDALDDPETAYVRKGRIEASLTPRVVVINREAIRG
jgi:hypothetical protein